MNAVYLCLGGNIGDRENYLKLAINLITIHVGNIQSESGIYETEAWGVDSQQTYLNMCLLVNTNLASHNLINTLLNIEKEIGRTRSLSQTYEARTIDIDILFFNNDIIDIEFLIVPHPRLHLRKFVLVPLHDIAPNYLHPAFNKTIFNLLNECNDPSEVKHFYPQN